MMNQLAHESSPYLLQHAHNPVNWFPWGEAALQKAKQENKPIIVSIGYSACHWCHVMERESFENDQVAAVMNQHFVCIKVDREERPDVDAVYMDAVQAMGVRGGWPLNVFLLPDGKPFYGGTYFDAQRWVNLCLGVRDAFDTKLADVTASAEAFVHDLNQKESQKYQFGEALGLQKADLTDAFEKIAYKFDTDLGGMDRAPKFPMPAIWLFMLRYAAVTNDNRAMSQTLLTLDQMAMGGIYDHVGGGFARYSTDAKWLLPHFEKMLYDNGQLLGLYAEAYHATKDQNPIRTAAYKRIMLQTVAWLEREMTSPEGGFYSALDADSEGKEGKFYVWEKAEIDTILEADSERFCELYDVTEAGNFIDEATGHPEGTNILNTAIFSEPDQQEFLDQCLEKLFEVRKNRIHPGLDDKILCSWNALMLKGLIDAYTVLNDEEILVLALKNALFIKNKMSISVQDEDGSEARGLYHSYKNGKASIVAYLEDYATLITAYTALYEATFDETWLLEAQLLSKYAIANFYDAEEGFFFFTDSQADPLIARKKELFDNVVPASNSIMANTLFRLGTMLDEPQYVEIAKQMLAKMQPLLLGQLDWLSNWGTLACHIVSPMAEVIIIGQNALGTSKKLAESYFPNKIRMGSQQESNLGLLAGRKALGESTKIFVCYNKTCQLPTTDIETALEILRE